MYIYCISGLGADERLFRNLKLENAEIKYIHWIKPDHQDNVSTYAEKLIPQIDLTHPFALLGVSLGGILAVELSLKINPEKVFVISSLKSSKEFPIYIRFFRWTNIGYLITAKLLKSTKPIIQLLFGQMNASDKNLIYKMIDDADNDFTPWAAKAIIKWQSKDAEIPFEKIVQIVGDKDLILKTIDIKNCHVIKDGTHLMILNKTHLINTIVDQNL
jgi:esterase/lipase